MAQKNIELHFARAKWLAYFTIWYNLAEGIISTYFGLKDETLSLLGFGVDSFVEMISGLGIVIMIERIKRNPRSHIGNFEKTALQITGYSLYILAAGLIFSAIVSIVGKHIPTNTFVGTMVAGVSIIVMWWLIQQKIHVGTILKSDAIISDARCAQVCMYMSAVLLVSCLVNYFYTVPYVDAVGALGIAWFSFTEGKEALEKSRGVICCHHH